MTKGKVMGADQVRYGGSRMTGHELYTESKCALCGKKFLRTGEHVYRREDRGTKWYCSYTCFRVKAREDEAKAREKIERQMTSDIRREEQLRNRDKRRWGYKCGKNWEYVTFECEEDAKAYAEHAQKKIELYTQDLHAAEPGTGAQEAAKRNLARWRRILKNIKVMEA